MGQRSLPSRRVHQLPRPGSKILDEQIERLRREQPPGPLKLSGYPTDPLPPHICDAAARAIGENAIAPSAGRLDLREAIANKLKNDNDIAVDPHTQVLVTHGAMHAVHLILQAVLEPADEVLMFSPTYFFGGLIELARGRPVYAPTRADDGFRFDVESLERALTARTKVLLLNCPCNPTGYLPSADKLRAIAQLAEQHDLLIVSDESYEKFVYDGRRTISIGSFVEVRDRTLTIQSFTKTYGMAGWRLGYIAGPPPHIDAARKILEWTGLMCNNPGQAAAVAAIEGPQEWFREILQRFERNRDVLSEAVDSIPNVSAVRPASTPFLLLNVSRLSETPAQLSQRLLVEHGIPSVPGEAFEAPGHLRVPFGGKTEAVAEAGRRLAQALA